MERLVDFKYSELISAGFDILPPGIADKLKYTHFFTGTDPIYAGVVTHEKTRDGRSFGNMWCVSYPFHLKGLSVKDRQTTVTLTSHSPKGYPRRLLPMLIVHELGHVLDGLLGFTHIAEPITKNARISHMEAFADAFTSWLNPGYRQYYEHLREVDERTLSLFREVEELWFGTSR